MSFPIRVRLALMVGVTFAMATGAALAAVYLLMSRLFTPAVAPVPPDGGTATPVEGGGRVLDSLLLALGMTLVMCVLGAVLVGWFLAGRMLAPLRQVTATAAGIAAGSLHRRVALSGPRDELKDLADTFDSMLARLESAFDVQQRFAANASHELLTPLATS
ncbi:MAG TPA: HAMP domain-containing protein, partial [Trebonia sp.]